MDSDETRTGNVRVEFLLPPEVFAWLERRSGQVYKSRGGFLRDLLVSMYRKDTQVPNPVTMTSTVPGSHTVTT